MGKQTTTWKTEERETARDHGTERRGPDFTRGDGGNSDWESEFYEAEIKINARPSWGNILAAVAQIEVATELSGSGKIPIAILRKTGDKKDNRIVCIRYEVWKEHFLQGPR